MRKYEKALCIALSVMNMFLPIGSLLLLIFGYKITMRGNEYFALVTLILSIALIVLSAGTGKYDREGVMAVLYPLLAPGSFISTVFYCRYSSLIALSFMLISSFCCFYLSLLYSNRGRGFREASGIISGLMILPVLAICFFSVLFGNFGEDILLKSKLSPDGKYIAEAIYSDQGALGGDGVIEVSKAAELDLGILIIEGRQKNVYIGEFWDGSNIAMQWQDNNSLIVEGKVVFKG